MGQCFKYLGAVHYKFKLHIANQANYLRLLRSGGKQVVRHKREIEAKRDRGFVLWATSEV